jgi:DNA-binding NarL/FixJ family response regulator
MTEQRAYRAAMPPETAAAMLREQGRLGKLDSQCVEAVLASVGQPATVQRRSWPADLTNREIEVLRLAARGMSDREIAQQLSVSRKTVGHHIEHIYGKTGLSTRPGLALFAMQNELLT